MPAEESEFPDDVEVEKEYSIREGSPLEFDLPEPKVLQAELSGYEVRDLIGIGGMGAIYRGYQPQLDRQVAIKVLKPGEGISGEFSEHFRTEAQAMARMNHTHIIAVHDFGETESGLLYIVMEFVEGELLFDLIEQKRITKESAIEIMRQVCDALQYAHYQGVVHRDIKPANIMISSANEVKIADFGLAKLNLMDGGSRGLGDEAYGTAEYVAPEVMDDDAEVDHRADIYSLGVLFYELLVGQPPRGDYLPPSEIVRTDPRFDLLIASAMNPDRESRYQQALDFKSALEGIVSTPAPAPQAGKAPRKTAVMPVAAAVRPATAAVRGRPVGVRPGIRPGMVPPSSGSNNWWVWVLSLAAVGALIGGYFFMKAQEEKRKKGPIRVVREKKPDGTETLKEKTPEVKKKAKKLDAVEELGRSLGVDDPP